MDSMKLDSTSLEPTVKTTTEQAVVFGRQQNLVGVYQGTVDSIAPDTAVIFVTPGMLHHVGPFRLHVDLARTLSQRGVASLRFDLSGIGESFGIGASGRSIDRAGDEIAEAIDWMNQQHGIQRVILFGLCSGADDALHTAQRDPRVVGVVAMDACGYPTRKFWINRIRSHYLPRLMSPAAWQRRAAKIADRLGGGNGPHFTSMPAGTDVREFPTRDIAAIEFQSLVDQGCRLHFLYTGGMSETVNYAEQLFDALPSVDWKGMASVEYFGEMDHVAILSEDRKKVVGHVSDQMVSMVSAG